MLVFQSINRLFAERLMIDDSVKIMGALATLITSVAWPIVAAWLISKFAPVIRDFLANMSEGSVKAFGIEANAKRNAAVQIVKADLKRNALENGSQTNLQLLTKTEKSIRYADAITHIMPLRELKGKRVLWVDEEPDDTFFERSALTELGLEVDVQPTVDHAYRAISDQKYHVVVLVDTQATLPSERVTLIERLKAREIPYVVYQNRPYLDKKDLDASGAYGFADNTSDLVLFVGSALQGLYGSDAMQSYVYWQEFMRRSKMPASQPLPRAERSSPGP
jgi:hypothetical protein